MHGARLAEVSCARSCVFCRWCAVGRCHALLCCCSVDGHPLPIEELKGIKAVESIDLSNKRLGIASAIIISACIVGNMHLHELKYALLTNPPSAVLGDVTPQHTFVLFWVQIGQQHALRPRLSRQRHLHRRGDRCADGGGQEKQHSVVKVS